MFLTCFFSYYFIILLLTWWLHGHVTYTLQDTTDVLTWVSVYTATDRGEYSLLLPLLYADTHVKSFIVSEWVSKWVSEVVDLFLFTIKKIILYF